jgi:ribosome-associated toxin RatA of RatAB toxin-antitoxin module
MLYFALFIIIIKSLKSRLIKLPFKFIKTLYQFIEKKEKKVIARLRLSFKVLGIKKKNNLKL